MATRKRLFVSACEPSANVHLKSLAQKLNPSIQICGIFEEEIFAHFDDAKPSYTLKDFAVMGFFDVMKKLSFFKHAIDQMSKLAAQCDVVLLMDSSSFNIPIAKSLRDNAKKVPVIYYVLPQVWAWKPWRARQLEIMCDYLCSILPFESKLYPNAQKQNKFKYVGHPLLDEIPKLKDKPTPLEDGQIAFMPGSRKSEIKRIFPIFAKVAKQLPSTHKKVLVLPEYFKNQTQEMLKQLYGEGIDSFELSFDANRALYESSFAFVCSGTATLQATLIGTPIVLGYKTRGTDVMIARAFVKLKYIGIANIIYNALHFGDTHAGKAHIHLEFIQGEMNAINLLKAYNDTYPQVFFAKSLELRAYLAHGSRENVIALLSQLLSL